jgi:hypothetical protein
MTDRIEFIQLSREQYRQDLREAAELGARLALERVKIEAAPQEWLNRKQAAQLLGVRSTTTVDSYVTAGQLTRYSDRHGRPRFKADEVRALFNRKNRKI